MPVLETIRLQGIDALFPTARRKVFPVIPAVLAGGLVAGFDEFEYLLWGRKSGLRFARH